MEMSRLAGKCCMVSGAGSGIGRASCIEFASEGGNVLCCDVSVADLQETVRLIREAYPGVKCEMMKADVQDKEQVKMAVDKCVSLFGRIDVCFANAGVVGPSKTFMGTSKQDFDDVFHVNVLGVWNCFKYAAKKMLEKDTQGSLIATASVAGMKAGLGSAVYCASKAAVISLCRSVSNELSGTGIRCNAICPGVIETGMTNTHLKGDILGGAALMNSLERIGQAKEVASCALFLACDESAFVNGSAIPVDGGFQSIHPYSVRFPLFSKNKL
mmetsp:Transcript_13271/g.21646  ORF Transcript_13271/g.21646 Transcript_13271/m.21646 type:complete len:271 (-) Transcript_13271:1442-2254(-)